MWSQSHAGLESCFNVKPNYTSNNNEQMFSVFVLSSLSLSFEPSFWNLLIWWSHQRHCWFVHDASTVLLTTQKLPLF